MSIKKSELKKTCEMMQEQINYLSDKVKNLENNLAIVQLKVHNPLQLNLFDYVKPSHCSQCNNDLSKMQSCGSVNCPYSLKVTCNGC